MRCAGGMMATGVWGGASVTQPVGIDRRGAPLRRRGAGVRGRVLARAPGAGAAAGRVDEEDGVAAQAANPGGEPRRGGKGSPRPPRVEVERARVEDFWALSTAHCEAFYADAVAPLAAFFRMAVLLELLDEERERTMSPEDKARRSAEDDALAEVFGLRGTSSGASSSSGSSGSAVEGLPKGKTVNVVLREPGAETRWRPAHPPPLGTRAVLWTGGIPRSLLSQIAWDPERDAAAYASCLSGSVRCDTKTMHLLTRRAHDSNKGPDPHLQARVLRRAKRMAYVSNLSVRSERRRRGLARNLMDAAEAQAREWGCTAVALHVDVSDAPVVAFYRGLGYRLVYVEPEWVRYASLRPKVRLQLMLKRIAAPQ